MARVISFVNPLHKTGKTTSTLHLGESLSKMNKKVLIVDLDWQCELTTRSGVDPTNQTFNITTMFEFGAFHLKNSIVNIKSNLYLLPSSIDLAWFTYQGFYEDFESILSLIIKNFSTYDYILIDSPSVLSQLTKTILEQSDEVIIPCSVDRTGYRSITLVEDTILDVQKKSNPDLLFTGLIATSYDKKIKDSKMILEEMEDEYTLLTTINKKDKKIEYKFDEAAQKIISGYALLSEKSS